MIKTLHVIMLVLSMRYAATTSSDLPVGRAPVEGLPRDSSRYVVLPYTAASFWVFSKGTPAGLSPTEVDAVRCLIKTTIVLHNKRTKLPDYQVHALGRYYLQLVAVINAQGEKEVWVNGLCSVDGNRWKKEIIHVMDGGNCYFQVKVNLSKKISYELRVNGYA